jgi:hypothetical protein
MKWPPFDRPPLAQPGEVNYDTFDRYTWAHLAIGVFYGALQLHLLWVFVLALGGELVENGLKAKLPFIFPHATADTLRNSVGDIAAVLAGWGLVHFFA